MTNIIRSEKKSEAFRKATFEPIVDAEGNVQGLRELKIPTDRTTGIEAMDRLFKTGEANDEAVDAMGWTFKQRRILNTPAPVDCHICKTSPKYDASEGDHKEEMVLLLDYAVVWRLFEQLFDGQYSIKISQIEYDSEEVMPAGTTGGSGEAKDAPGRVFYARAHVEITLHLRNGTERVYEGVGVSYDQLKIAQTGNVYSINSARRTAEKGAVSDAKREALANIGRVFRRAFEDGSEMKAYMENELLGAMAEHAKPKIHLQGATVSAPRKAPDVKVAAPTSKNETQPAKQKVAQAAEKKVDLSTQRESDREIEQNSDADNDISIGEDREPTLHMSLSEDEHIPLRASEFEEAFLEHAMGCETHHALDQFVSLNSSGLAAVDLKAQISEIRSEIEDDPEAGKEDQSSDHQSAEQEDGIPDFEVQSTSSEEAVEEEENEPEVDEDIIDPEGKSGKSILSEFKALFASAKSEAHLDTIVTKNKKASRKMTPKQLGAMVEARVARASKF